MTTQTKPKTRKLTSTERVLIAMLTENTGQHMLDSGGAYGRAWERNQGRDFTSEPAATLEISECNGQPEISVTLNVFHWLAERLTYDPHKTAAFKRWANRPENRDNGWLKLMDEWAEKQPHSRNCQTVNTYNGDDLLSQTLQYTYFETDDGYYVLLQIHGGCDVRGGYTAPRVFRCEEHGLWDNSQATIWEEMPEYLKDQLALPGLPRRIVDNYWQTDELEDCPVTRDENEKGQGKIYIDAEGNAYGPLYGGRLRVSF